MPHLSFAPHYDGGDATPVAQYFLAQAQEYGELITNLKMQKLVYYAYAGTLVTLNERLFQSRIEAWPNGPVVRPLYGELKQYGFSAIPEEFLQGQSIDDVRKVFTADQIELLNKVIVRYGSLSAFELVLLTHAEDPWLSARKGLGPTEPSQNPIEDDVIRSAYTPNDFEVDDEWIGF